MVLAPAPVQRVRGLLAEDQLKLVRERDASGSARRRQDPPVLIWHDLFLDLVGVPDGSFTVRDDDELLASGLANADPELHARILEAQSELIRRFERRLPPSPICPR